MAFWVYVLRCSDGSYYTGHTEDLDKRIQMHHQGEIAGYTASRRPLQLVFSQECASRTEALSSERQIKGWNRGKKEAMFRGDWREVNRLSRGKHRSQR